jgi:hypothetical protein
LDGPKPQFCTLIFDFCILEPATGQFEFDAQNRPFQRLGGDLGRIQAEAGSCEPDSGEKNLKISKKTLAFGGRRL